VNHLETNNPDIEVDGFKEVDGSVLGVVLNLKGAGKWIQPVPTRVLFIK
jgi:hypothetical protein